MIPSGAILCLRASARSSNKRSSISSSRAGSYSIARAAAFNLSSASLASITARSSDVSASANKGWASANRSSLRAALRMSDRPLLGPSKLSSTVFKSSAMRSPFCMSERSPASCSSSPGCGWNAASSETECSSHSRSRAAFSRASRAISSRDLASCHAAKLAETVAVSLRPKASNKLRCPRAFNIPRSSCWPWISTKAAPTSRKSAAEHGWSLINALLPPSAFTDRRMIKGSSISMSMSFSASNAATYAGDSKLAATCAFSAPDLTSPLSARAPSARPSASSNIDFPAPVSPVRTPSPPANSRSSASISTTSRIESPVSMALRGGRVLLHQVIGTGIPFAARIVGAQHGRCLLCLFRHAHRKIAFGQAIQSLWCVRGRVIFLDHFAEAQR